MRYAATLYTGAANSQRIPRIEPQHTTTMVWCGTVMIGWALIANSSPHELWMSYAVTFYKAAGI